MVTDCMQNAGLVAACGDFLTDLVVTSGLADVVNSLASIAVSNSSTTHTLKLSSGSTLIIQKEAVDLLVRCFESYTVVQMLGCCAEGITTKVSPQHALLCSTIAKLPDTIQHSYFKPK
jgi:hypothetical protein